MTVQIAAIRIIKAPFIQDMLVSLVFIFFRFRASLLPFLHEIGFHVLLGLNLRRSAFRTEFSERLLLLNFSI